LSGLYVDFIFEISRSGSTADATKCKKGKTGAKRREKKLLCFLNEVEAGAQRRDQKTHKKLIFVEAVSKTGASVGPGSIFYKSVVFDKLKKIFLDGIIQISENIYIGWTLSVFCF
jgi:hypothetical protein